MNRDVPSLRTELTAFGILSLTIASLAGVLALWPATITETYRGVVPGTPGGYFKAIFGTIPPLVVIALAAAVGTLALGYLRARGWFTIYGRHPSGIATAVAAGLLLGLAAAAAETAGLFREPRDTNVPLPYALLFYPVAGYVVEVLFKALPLAVLLSLLSTATTRFELGRWLSRGRIAWAAIVVVALVEPLYMVTVEPDPLSFAALYVGVHVFAINLAQLYVFRRYDFVSMYALRLAYYVVWHVIWADVRLQLLF